MNELNILLTSVGRRSYLVKYFKNVLNGEGKVHVANSSDISPAFQAADYSVVTPLIYDEQYIPFLLNYCKDNQIKAIISLFDIDLPILSQHKKDFKEIGVTVIVSDYNVIEKCNDKWKTYLFLTNNDFNVPKTYIDLNSALKDIKTGKITYPLMIKPRWGMGSIAIFEAENEQELKVFYEKTKRNISKTYLKYESESDIDKCVLIQEKLHGQEYGLDIINDLNQNYITTIVKQKYAMRSGETDCAVTVDNHKLKLLGENLSKKLHHIANLDVDVFVVNDKPYVLEMNGRFGGGYPFSHMAGVNLPCAIVKWLKEEKVDKSLLSERINIMSQKDINLVRLYQTTDYCIEEISNQYEIKMLIENFEKMLTPTLSERKVDISQYAQKIHRNANTYVAKNVEDKIMGMISAYMNDTKSNTAYITILAVDDKYRGLKIGERLLKLVEDKSKEAGLLKVKLEVRVNNYTAVSFYKHFGYSVVDQTLDESYYMEKQV